MLPEAVNLSRYPFRGIYTEIAREDGVTRQAIQQAARKGNPHILNRIAEKIEQRKAMLKKYESAVSVPMESDHADPGTAPGD